MESTANIGFVHKNAFFLKSFLRIVFGLIWLVDAFFKFQPEFSQNLPDLIREGATSQPNWLNSWFNFWVDATTANPIFWSYLIGLTELGLAFSLIFGFMRKFGYLVGILTSLVIWGVPEGFGGPYGPTSTDIGTGIIYAMVFLLFIMINAMEGPSHYSLDYYIEQKFRFWRIVAEFS